ncbi:hypothetical protein BABINDRAFT_10707 [Babjeviella inositovora NRRL Y-12698]|uniref:Uncharacterized protein n=1 Tax=Babjeviella inositovora NRRL Y-12698 TaxID=984486 RepID=A0A1E3QXB4_9ASCO|nr:uncharacterized protein BABINDRAFT_10707 [Babjeviella inositovora NRRL Y-12698]ODQ82241.1 hypothetical protein BABINDRAFT_10707 [Babjeviella inositovora NRRL Y-12698]
MSEPALNEYIPTIDAILNVSDFEKISVKKIRNALQALFEVDFHPYKKQIQQLIILRYNLLLSLREEGHLGPAPTPSEELENTVTKLRLENEILAARLNSHVTAKVIEENNSPVEKRKVKRKTNTDDNTEKKKIKRNTENNAFTRPLRLSAQLAAFLGVESCARTEVVKKMWDYIKTHNLQNPEDRREILCDAKMEHVFQTNKMTMFSMNKYLVEHLSKIE